MLNKKKPGITCYRAGVNTVRLNRRRNHQPSVTFSNIGPIDFKAPFRVEIALNTLRSTRLDTARVDPSPNAKQHNSP